MAGLIGLIQLVSFIITLAVLAYVVVSYLLSPYHPVRRTLDSLVGPLLTPIRRVLPPVGAFDFSPMVLLILVWLVQEFLIRILLSVS